MTENPSLKIVFMGTPDFAVPALEILQASSHEVQAVVTVPDQQQGRGQQWSPSSVKLKAQELGLPVFQPLNLRDPGFLSQLQDLQPDLIVVVAFRILPEAVFSLPRLGSFNLHASLLPRYRGAAPIHWALLNGDLETGVTTFFLQRTVDTGNIILQRGLRIHPEDNLHTLYERLCGLGAEVVLRSANLIAAGQVKPVSQDNTLASPAPKVTPEDQRLDFSESAQRCHNRVRAFAPKPGAFCFRQGLRLKILASRISAGSGAPGVVLQVGSDHFRVGCGSGSLEIWTVQPDSKKIMDAAAYLRGYPLQTGDHLD